jgi:WD40 repeat protein
MIVSGGSLDESLKIWKINKEGIWNCTQTIDQHNEPFRIVIINCDSTMILSSS